MWFLRWCVCLFVLFAFMFLLGQRMKFPLPWPAKSTQLCVAAPMAPHNAMLCFLLLQEMHVPWSADQQRLLSACAYILISKCNLSRCLPHSSNWCLPGACRASTPLQHGFSRCASFCAREERCASAIEGMERKFYLLIWHGPGSQASGV